jgi:hypothetical protein
MPLSRAQASCLRSRAATRARNFRARQGPAFRAAEATRKRNERAKKRTASLLEHDEFVSAKKETKRLRSELARTNDLVVSLREQLEQERARAAPKPAEVLLEVCAAYVFVSLCSTTSPVVCLPFCGVSVVFRCRLCVVISFCVHHFLAPRSSRAARLDSAHRCPDHLRAGARVSCVTRGSRDRCCVSDSVLAASHCCLRHPFPLRYSDSS